MITREEIIATTGKLFLKRGCKSVTMDEVAQENGISKRTLYEVFPDKASLLDACINAGRVRNNKFLETVYKKSPNILEFILMLHEFQSETVVNMHHDFFRDLKRYYPTIYTKRVIAIQKEYVGKMENILKLGQNEGVFRGDINVKLAANMLTEIINIVNSTDILDRISISKKEIVRETIIAYLRGLSSLRGIDIIDNFLERNRKGEPFYRKLMEDEGLFDNLV